MHQFGKVDIPQEAFIAALKVDGQGSNRASQTQALIQLEVLLTGPAYVDSSD
jgi:hypothetical protein